MKRLEELTTLAARCNSMSAIEDLNAAYVNFITNIEPGDIVAIAEAFDQIKKRAEAAEKERDRRIADYKRLIDQHMPRTIDGCDEGWSRVIEAHELQTKLEAAEAKLAELEKQEAAGKFAFEPLAERYHHIKHGEAQHMEPKLPLVKLFTRPAPAINLADFVPKKLTHQMGDYPVNTASINSWNACVDAILRNIEEQTK